jgi:hypothetical protein
MFKCSRAFAVMFVFDGLERRLKNKPETETKIEA